jgi:flagellar assembly factor FliW
MEKERSIKLDGYNYIATSSSQSHSYENFLSPVTLNTKKALSFQAFSSEEYVFLYMLFLISASGDG